MNKFEGRNWVKRDQKRDFGVKSGGFPRGKTQEQGTCSSVARWTSCTMMHPMFWVFWVLQGRSGLSKLIILMYLTVVMLSKPLETTIELD